MLSMDLAWRALIGIVLAVFTAGSAHAQALVKWRHGLVDAKADAGIFFMALEKGFFKKHGLDVEFIQLRGDLHVFRALLARELDSAEPSPGAPLNGIDKGADVVFFGSSMEGYPYALFVRKEITSWEQLKGKIFGVSSPGSTPDLIAREMLRAKGIDPSSIQIANAGGTSGRIKALVGGKIDATAAGSEYVAQQDKLGIHALGFAKDLVPNWPRFVFVTERTTLKARRPDLVKFVAGYIEGLSYAMEHREEMIALGKKVAKARPDDPNFAYLFDEAKAGNYVSPTAAMTPAKLRWLHDVLLKAGVLKKPIDLDKHIDLTIREDALKLLGRGG
ncbi:MAG: ABC transporter substrate-binding protein [Hyphomicrobiaceae bacterium]